MSDDGGHSDDGEDDDADADGMLVLTKSPWAHCVGFMVHGSYLRALSPKTIWHIWEYAGYGGLGTQA